MTSILDLLKEGRNRDVWRKYCGFIDLSINEFMLVQERLLMEQLDLLSRCELGKKLIGKSTPKSVAEFRRSVPLTSYQDYHQHLLEKREDILPAKPEHWVCTSGIMGNYQYKWAPYSKGMVQAHIKNFLASVIFSVCNKRADFSLREYYKFLYAMAPPPYLTGMVPYGLKEEFPFDYLPPLPVAEKMTFEERNREGFRLGLTRGIDLFFGVSSVLVKIGEKFSREESGGSDMGVSGSLAKLRLGWGLAKSRYNRRSLLPKDVWNLKGIICAGTDTAFYKDRIEYYWGKKPIEIYGGTEIGIAATQTWDHEGMVFFPDANFWEFVPEEEYYKSKANPAYSPATVLTNELESGKRYEMVITNFRGGAFVRYRLGDLIKVLDTRNERLDIDLPQIIYEDRAYDVIDLANFTRITERTLWEALKKAGITDGNWIARKSFAEDHPVMELYLEVKEKSEANDIGENIHFALRSVDSDYHDLENIIGYRPMKLVPIPEGSIKKVLQAQRENKDVLQLEAVSRINPNEKFMTELSAILN